jgi:hypothetical protein
VADAVLAYRDHLRDLGVPAYAAGPGDLFPQVVVTRVGGAPAGAAGAVEEPLLQLDVWADSYTEVVELADTVTRDVEGLAHTDLDGGCLAYGGYVASTIDAPDPDTNRPRRVITAALTVLHTP